MTVGEDPGLQAEGPDEPARSRLLTLARQVAVDIGPLRDSRHFRRLFFGDAVSLIGTQMTAVAVPVQMFALTKSSFAVGMLGLAALVPLVVFGIIGGAIADAMDRRRLVLMTSAGAAVVSMLLLLQAVLDVGQPWLLYVLVFAQAALFAVDSPARRSLIPRLIAPSQIPAASALGQAMFSFGVVLGPLVGGSLIGAFGLSWAYAIDVCSFGAALWAAALLPSLRPEGGGRAAGVGSILEGLRFLRTKPVVLMTFAVDINAMVFGMPRALFPALAVGTFGGGPRTVGLLYAAPAAGALLAAVLSGWLGQVRRQGLAVLFAVAAWGAAIVAFGLTSTLWLGLLMLAIAGAADMVSAVFRTAILTAATPDELRGRLSGVFIAVVAGGPRLGDVEAGAVAAVSSTQVSVVSGGVACIIGVLLLGLAIPSFARYDAAAPDAADPDDAAPADAADP